MDRNVLNAWVGREQNVTESVADRLLAQFHATFGTHLFDTDANSAPLGSQWCLATPDTATDSLNVDGHPPRGDFLPPIALPRRMWAGGRLVCYSSLPINQPVHRNSQIRSIKWKDGKSGTLCFVKVTHHYKHTERLLITEEQDIVYRSAAKNAAPPTPVAMPGEPAGADRTVDASATLLFRYSAMTFNSHRIHYDKDYARTQEGYAGLVVQGPLQATMLLNHAARILGTHRLDFSYRGVAPLIGEQLFGLCHQQSNEGIKCWTRGSDGTTAMTAEAKPLL